MREELLLKIRKVEDADRGKLPTVSFSKLDLLESCNHKFKLRYVDKNYSKSSAIHFDLGNLAHKVLEIKGRWIINKEPIDYEQLKNIMLEGIEEKTSKGSEKIVGINEIRKQYFEDWYTPDNKSGTNYEEKVDLFMNKVMYESMEEDPLTTPKETELPFEFVYQYGVDGSGNVKEAIIHGFIDRVDSISIVDEDTGEITGEAIGVVDYKTSKKVFDDSKIKTPLQMVIYGLSCLHIYGEIPERYTYKFVFIDESQDACSKGYMKRGVKKLDSLLNQIDELEVSGEYIPKPTPLCYWCDFASHTPNADPNLKHMCPYYSLWTPTNRSFATNQPYVVGQEASKEAPVVRKLIF